MNNKAFSLVELIVVIAVMAILVGIAVPVYSSYIDNAKEAKDAEYLDNLTRAAQVFAADKGLALQSIWVAPVIEGSKGIELYLSDGSYYDGDLSELYAMIGAYDFETIETDREIVYIDDVTPVAPPSASEGTCASHNVTTKKEPDCYNDGYKACENEGCGYVEIIPGGHKLSETVYGNLHVQKCANCDYVNVYFDGDLIE